MDISSLKIYTDGSGDGRIAWYNEDTKESSLDNLIMDVSNNEAEYWAVFDALYFVKKSLEDNPNSRYKKETEIMIWSDSMLLVKQLSREWNIKSKNMREMTQKVWELISLLDLYGIDVKFKWIRRKENKAGKMLG